MWNYSSVSLACHYPSPEALRANADAYTCPPTFPRMRRPCNCDFFSILPSRRPSFSRFNLSTITLPPSLTNLGKILATSFDPDSQITTSRKVSTLTHERKDRATSCPWSRLQTLETRYYTKNSYNNRKETRLGWNIMHANYRVTMKNTRKGDVSDNWETTFRKTITDFRYIGSVSPVPLATGPRSRSARYRHYSDTW